MANMVMFAPFGVLLTDLLEYNVMWKKHSIIQVVCSAILFSMMIETLQLVLMRGIFEWDDVISNTIGAFSGSIFYRKFIKRVYNTAIVLCIVSILIIVCCVAVIIKERFVADDESDLTPRTFCFQVDEVKYSGGEAKITGFAFRYDHDIEDFIVILKSTKTGKMMKLKTERMERPDVNEYFLCDHDYSESGFVASGVMDAKEEYEVMVNWDTLISISTGIYITGTEIHYAPEDEFVPSSGGEDLKNIIENGTLRVYRPDYHCWVYQLGTALYWIADKEFAFEEDGSTYIQYQLWTTQEDRLPKIRLENGWMWDNIGGTFEEYELKGDFGPYRVSCRDLPEEYSITSIVTGYYNHGEWIWKNYFRPDYKFLF